MAPGSRFLMVILVVGAVALPGSASSESMTRAVSSDPRANCKAQSDPSRGWECHYVSVVDVEPTYMPDRVSFAIAVYPKQWCKSSYLSWPGQGTLRGTRRANTAAVLATLTNALSHGLLASVHGKGCNATHLHVYR